MEKDTSESSLAGRHITFHKPLQVPSCGRQKITPKIIKTGRDGSTVQTAEELKAESATVSVFLLQGRGGKRRQFAPELRHGTAILGASLLGCVMITMTKTMCCGTAMVGDGLWVSKLLTSNPSFNFITKLLLWVGEVWAKLGVSFL